MQSDKVLAQIRFDMRSPAIGAPTGKLYAAALDMAEYADAHGFNSIFTAEHHGSPDGYLPASCVLGAGLAARTKRATICLYAIVVPLYDPLRLAEDLAVLDHVAQGRLSVCAAGGYLNAEYAMFGKNYGQRGKQVEEIVGVLRQAWTGEPFQFQGRTVQVTPKPFTKGGPELKLGGSIPAAAKRAARIADGLVTHLPDLYQIYADEAVKLGKRPAPFRRKGPTCMFVAEDKEKGWASVLPHFLHDFNEYGRWAHSAASPGSPFKEATSREDLAGSMYQVVTPDEAIALGRDREELYVHPLIGGLDPEVGWSSLRMFAEKVLPAVRGQ